MTRLNAKPKDGRPRRIGGEPPEGEAEMKEAILVHRADRLGADGRGELHGFARSSVEPATQENECLRMLR